MLTRDFRGYGAAEGDAASPTVGVSITPWVIALIAVVWLVPKLYHVHRVTRDEKK